jgi:hypothetical protein
MLTGGAKGNVIGFLAAIAFSPIALLMWMLYLLSLAVVPIKKEKPKKNIGANVI